MRKTTIAWLIFLIGSCNHERVATEAELGVEITDGGRVVSAPHGIDCGRACVQQFPGGEVVVLHAEADENFDFDGWDGPCDEGGSPAECVVRVDGYQIVRATFRQQMAKIEIRLDTSDAPGTVVSSPGGIYCPPACEYEFPVGSPLELKAYAEASSNFVEWDFLEDAYQYCDGGRCRFDVQGDLEFWARFEESGGNLLWARETKGFVVPTALASIDNEIIMAGVARGAVEMCGGPLAEHGTQDVLVARFDSNGECVWAKRFGGPDSDGSTSVAVTSTGNVIVGGWFRESMTVGGITITSHGDDDALLLTLGASDGAVVDVLGFGDAQPDRITDLAASAAGSYAFAGTYSGTIHIGGDTYTASDSDVVVGEWTAAGALGWTESYDRGPGPNGEQMPARLAYQDGSILVLSMPYFDSVTIGGQHMASPQGDASLFVELAAGLVVRATSIPGIWVTSLVGNGDASVLFGGYFDGDLWFSDTLLRNSSAVTWAMARLGQSGISDWAQRLPRHDDASAPLLSPEVGPGGVVTLAGKFVGPADLGGGMVDSLPGEPNRNYVVAKYTIDGAHLWSHSHFVNHFALNDESTGVLEPHREPITVLNDGSVVIAVSSAGEVRFEGLKFGGSQGMVLARFSP